MLPVWALAVALQLQAPADIVLAAEEAWHAESHAAHERAWLDELTAEPADPAARLGLGALYFVSFRYAEAVEQLELLVSADSSPAAYEAYAHYLIGASRSFAGEFAAADAALVEAGRAAIALGDSTLVTLALSARSGVTTRLRGFPAALAVIDSASAWTHAGSRSYPAYLCNRSGLDGSVPIDAIEAAADSAAARGDRRYASRCRFQAAVRLINLGLTEEVFVALPIAVATAEEARDYHGLATALQWGGYYHRIVGNYAGAEDELTRALEAGRASGNQAAVAWSLINLSAISGALGNPSEGIDYARQAATLLEEQGDLFGLATLSGFEGALWEAVGETGRARDSYADGLDAARSLGSVQTVMALEWSLAMLAMRNGELGEAGRRVDIYATIVRDNGLTGWDYSVAELRAELAKARGDHARADSILHRYTAVERQLTREAAFLARVAHGRAMLADLDSAHALASRSADLFDAFRELSSDEELRLHALQKEEGDRGFATVIAELARADRLDEAFELAERRRSRELFTQMAREDALGTRTVDRELDGVVPLSTIQAMLGDDVAILSYTAASGEPTTAITITSTRVVASVLDPVDGHRDAAERIASAAESGVELPELAAQLAGRLITPLHGLPDEVTRVIVVAEDVIHRVPLDMLPLDDGRLVVERFDLSHLPSATIGRHLWEEDPTATVGAVLSVGDPAWDEAAQASPVLRGEGLTPLPGSGREARNVARYGPTGLLLTGREASEERLRTMDLTGFDVIHLATHAFVDEQSASRSAVALAAGGGYDGFLTPTDLAALDLDAKLVTLSACRSGGGRLIRGEGLQGLTAPLLRAGADAVVATRWRVDDRLVGRFVDTFYAGLASGMDATSALGEAKRLRRSAGDPPSVWAAFTLVGDHRVTVPLRTPFRIPIWWWVTVPAGAVLFWTLSAAFRERARPRATA